MASTRPTPTSSGVTPATRWWPGGTTTGCPATPGGTGRRGTSAGPAGTGPGGGRRRGAALVLSGDLHSSWVARLASDEGRGPAVAAEFTVPAVSAPTFARALAPKVRGARSVLERMIRRANPQVAWVDTAAHGYLLLDVTPDRIEGQWWHVDRVGRPSEVERLAATWSVRRGDPEPF